MPPDYPSRPHDHVIATKSVRFFESHVPAQWTTNEPKNDYGVDLSVDIFDGGAATPYEFLVQLKSSRVSSTGDIEQIRLDVATYNLLWNKLQVAMLVKYCEDVNEAYWLLLKDVPPPNQENETFTVNIPKVNRLSNINWDEIKNYVRDITDGKIASWRARG